RNGRISDIIERAGGLTPDAYTNGATLFRRQEFTQQESQQTLANVEGATETLAQEESEKNEKKSAQVGIELPEVLENPGSKYELLLEEGVSLFVPTKLKNITVERSVLYPTTVRYEDGGSFKDYITAAGAFTDVDKEKHAYIICPNGDV